ncbi:TNT domain-containing protein [Amycolatopsis sp. NPDC005232]|uniref:TNT domain-containing protein n=1 Tax=Amycolatopsis sp. NPDC005232 TaxID=3157027 RepID=UPI0033A1C379
MPRWRQPELPDGPLRELNDELHRLHEFSGHRSTKEIADWLKARAEANPGEWSKPSHTRVHHILSKPELPNRPIMINIVEAFVALGRIRHGPDVVAKVDALWEAAYEHQRHARKNAVEDRVVDNLAPDIDADEPTPSAEIEHIALHTAEVDRRDESDDDTANSTDSAADLELMFPLNHTGSGHHQRNDRETVPGPETQPRPIDPPLTLFEDKRWRILAPGTRLDRFGDPSGNVTYAAGTMFEKRSLPPEWADRPYHVYRATNRLNVLTGAAVPWFDQPGGGQAFVLEKSIQELLDTHQLVEVEPGEPPIDADKRWPGPSTT